MQQHVILAVTVIAMLCVAIPFIVVARSTSSSAGKVGWLSEPARRSFFIFILVLGVGVTAATLWVWPHRVTQSASNQVINVTGYQWRWEIDSDTVKRGVPVVFNVHAGDVNHGMGVYDADQRLLFQVQAMPGYVNRVEYTFDKPGNYKVLCLEFCGLGHHVMLSEFSVTDDQSDEVSQ
jgi:cytochrome c oxidase subunit II